MVVLFISEQQRVSNEDEDGSQDEGDKHLDVDVVPGTVQLSEGISTLAGYCIFQSVQGRFSCDLMHISYMKKQVKREEKSRCVSHLNRQKMVMAMVRVISESVYPAVYMVFT